MPRRTRSGAIDPRDYLALIRGERHGPWAATLRGTLAVASGLYRAGSALRGAAYSSGVLRAVRAGVPVISVGNLTAGGTGKTPLVIHLAQALSQRGAKVAVLARGYGAAREGDKNDELLLSEEEVPGLLVLPGRDRAARAAEAVAAGASVLILDDGFQHRRVARDLDVVLVDASDPWGPGGLLPRGLLREPRSALKRASLVLITRAELASPEALAALEAEIRAAGHQGPIGRLRLTPRDLAPLSPGGGAPEPVTALQRARVLAVCAIGNPEAFRRTLLGLGARVQELLAFPDHAPFGAAQVEQVEAQARRAGAERVVVTAKDAVKLRPLLGAARLPWSALRIDVRPEPADVLAPILGLCSPASPSPGAGPATGTEAPHG